MCVLRCVTLLQMGGSDIYMRRGRGRGHARKVLANWLWKVLTVEDLSQS